MSSNSGDVNDHCNQIDFKDHKRHYKTAFLQKLFQILQSADLQPIICWIENGTSFQIKDKAKFISEVLPSYFRHNNFSSFVRQLNMYDFQKHVKRCSDLQVYTHPMFKKDKPKQIGLIKRKSNPYHTMQIQQKHNIGMLNGQFQCYQISPLSQPYLSRGFSTIQGQAPPGLPVFSGGYDHCLKYEQIQGMIKNQENSMQGWNPYMNIYNQFISNQDSAQNQLVNPHSLNQVHTNQLMQQTMQSNQQLIQANQLQYSMSGACPMGSYLPPYLYNPLGTPKMNGNISINQLDSVEFQKNEQINNKDHFEQEQLCEPNTGTISYSITRPDEINNKSIPAYYSACQKSGMADLGMLQTEDNMRFLDHIPKLQSMQQITSHSMQQRHSDCIDPQQNNSMLTGNKRKQPYFNHHHHDDMKRFKSTQQEQLSSQPFQSLNHPQTNFNLNQIMDQTTKKIEVLQNQTNDKQVSESANSKLQYSGHDSLQIPESRLSKLLGSFISFEKLVEKAIDQQTYSDDSCVLEYRNENPNFVKQVKNEVNKQSELEVKLIEYLNDQKAQVMKEIETLKKQKTQKV